MLTDRQTNQIRSLGERSARGMSAAIIEARSNGFDDLADELTAIRDLWVRTCAGHAERRAKTAGNGAALLAEIASEEATCSSK